MKIHIKLNNIKNSVIFKACSHIAPQVYQENVYAPKRFLSFKKVLSGMPAPYNTVELISVHSCSKGMKMFKTVILELQKVTMHALLLLLLGYVCECGLRAGFFEVVNMDPEVKSVLTASVAANLCPTVLGQVSEN